MKLYFACFVQHVINEIGMLVIIIYVEITNKRLLIFQIGMVAINRIIFINWHFYQLISKVGPLLALHMQRGTP